VLVSRGAQTLMSVDRVRESVQMASASTRRGLSDAMVTPATSLHRLKILKRPKNVMITTMISWQVFLTQLSDNVA